MSTTKRLTPGTATSVVLFITGIVLTLVCIGLAIAACNKAVLISGTVHFGLFMAGMAGAITTFVLGAAGDDGLYVWPTGGPADPPPFQLLPTIEWHRGRNNMMINYNVIGLGFAAWAVALMIASITKHPAILFSGWFHFLACAASILASFVCLKLAATCEDRINENNDGTNRTQWIIALAMIGCFAIVSIAAYNGTILFFPEFAFGICVLTLGIAGVAVYRAGRNFDRGKTTLVNTSEHLFIIAVGFVAEAVIAALIAFKMVLFSAGFHVTLVCVLLLLAGATAIVAALLRDRPQEHSSA